MRARILAETALSEEWRRDFERRSELEALAWEDQSLPDVIGVVRRLPYDIGHWVGPHDLEQRSDLTGENRVTVAPMAAT